MEKISQLRADIVCKQDHGTFIAEILELIPFSSSFFYLIILYKKIENTWHPCAWLKTSQDEIPYIPVCCWIRPFLPSFSPSPLFHPLPGPPFIDIVGTSSSIVALLQLAACADRHQKNAVRTISNHFATAEVPFID